MGIKNCLIISLMLMMCFVSIFDSSSAINQSDVNIQIVGENIKTRFGSPVVVAGIWHYINVTTEDTNFQNLILKLYKGDTIPNAIARNESNYYEFKYDKNNQQWIDLNEYEGYSYIDVNRSTKNNDIYSFCLGIKDSFPEVKDYYENWTLEIYEDTTKQYSSNVVIEKPMIGLAKAHADEIKFQLNPFEETSIEGNDYFTIENVGNLPLVTSIDYPAYNDILDITNSNEKLSSGDSLNNYVTLYSKSWKPGILEISGFVSGVVPSNLIITYGAFTFKPNITVNSADLKIYIGHSNYKIEPLSGSNIVFQYEEEIEMNESEIKDLKVYISGDGIVTLDISDDGENIQIKKVTAEDKVGTPLTITSTNTSEYEVTVQVEAIRENKVGIIQYELEVDGKTQTYETRVIIGPPQKDSTSDVINLPITTIIIILLVVIIAGYMIFSQIRHKRR